MSELYPLLFEPVYQDYIWGGTRIASAFGRDIDLPVCAESWEISERSEGMSVVSNGPLTGATLASLIDDHGEALLGASGRFPLLIKIIDAAKTLSVQVHPHNANAEQVNGEPKTEMWYILAADDDACVYLGTEDGVDGVAFRKAIDDGGVEPLLHRIPVKAGDAVFVPGGTMHAIGAGCLLMEVQQNSNTTYRVYDWGRVGHDGQPRELHIDQAMAVTEWTGPGLLLDFNTLSDTDSACVREVVRCPYFSMEEVQLRSELRLDTGQAGFTILFGVSGVTRISWGDDTLTLGAGVSCLIPSVTGAYTVTAQDSESRLLVVRP